MVQNDRLWKCDVEMSFKAHVILIVSTHLYVPDRPFRRRTVTEHTISKGDEISGSCQQKSSNCKL